MKKRGFTIVEVMITCAVLLILFGMIVQLLSPSMHLLGEGATKTELQQLGQLSVSQMVAELAKTTPTGVTLCINSTANEPMILATNPMFDTDSTTGSPVYLGLLQIFWNDPLTGNLYRKQTPQPPPAGLAFNPLTPIQVTRPILDPILIAPNGSERKLAHHVQSFSVEKQPTANGESEVYAIRLSLQEDLSGTPRKAQVDIWRKVFLRNH